MRTTPIFFSLLILPLAPLFAQDNHIELTITDTVDAPVARVVYLCAVQMDPSAYSSDLAYSRSVKKQQAYWQQTQDSLCGDQEELEAELRAKGFTIGSFTTRITRHNVTADVATNCASGVPVEVRSNAELDRLTALVRSKKNVNGTVWLWESDPDADKQASTRLYTIAREQAQQLARASGTRLGSMTMARDEKAGETATPQQANWNANNIWTAQNNLVPERRTMTFRFALLADDNPTGARP